MHPNVFILVDKDGFSSFIYGATLAELQDYVAGTPDERIYEYTFLREHPVNVDFQADPEGEDN